MDDKGGGIFERVVEGKEKIYKQRPKWNGELAKGLSDGGRGRRAFQAERAASARPQGGKSMAGLRQQRKVPVAKGELCREQIIGPVL